MRRIDERKELKAIELYRQELSEAKVAGELGVSPSTVHQILVRQGEPRRTISEALMKYPKADFSDDLAEQARILGFMDDCGAQYSHKQVEVQTSTTHPAQMKLFNDIFGRYGHVGSAPVYSSRQSYYQWELWVFLNVSFDFLIDYKRSPLKFLHKIARNGYEIVGIGSLTDAEGWVGIDANNGYPRAGLYITNNNRQLLEFTRRTIGGDIYPINDSYQLQLNGEEAVEAIRILPITHLDKAPAKELVLHYADKGGIGLDALRDYWELRRRIDEEVRLCKMQARLEWIRRHGRPHTKDADQTMLSKLTLTALPYGSNFPFFLKMNQFTQGKLSSTFDSATTKIS